MTNIGEMDAVELAARIAQADISPLEAVSAAIEACPRLNPDFNVLCSLRFERAIEDGHANRARVETTDAVAQPLAYAHRIKSNFSTEPMARVYSLKVSFK